MGLTAGLTGAVSFAFDALRQLYECLPTAFQLLIMGAAGIAILFGILRLFLH